MKKLVFILTILNFNFQLLTFNCIAQPNGGFENWSNVNNYQDPDNWQTFNILSIVSSSNLLSAFKATGVDKHSGNYALKLKTISVISNPNPQMLPDTIGDVFTGKITISPPSLMYGFFYTGRPEKLEFWSKYMPVGNDTGGARVILRKWNGTAPDTIATGETNIIATGAYTLFQINLMYSSTALPDTATIIFASSKSAAIARVGSTLYLDDVAFTGWVGIDDFRTSTANKVKIFPNPAKDNLSIFVQIDDAKNVQVVDSSGKLVGVYKIQNSGAKINTSTFAEGVYFYEIRDKKDMILTTEKFNVIK